MLAFIRSQLSRPRNLPWLIVLVVAAAPGCTGEVGPPRYRVSGTVTHRGEPVPIGVIQFTPDSSQGNSGPAGFAEIKDGRFDTDTSGKGAIGGPHLATVDAFTGENINPDLKPNGDILVSAYQKRLSLETDAETQLDLELTDR